MTRYVVLGYIFIHYRTSALDTKKDVTVFKMQRGKIHRVNIHECTQL